jgi:hypothetical protein
MRRDITNKFIMNKKVDKLRIESGRTVFIL